MATTTSQKTAKLRHRGESGAHREGAGRSVPQRDAGTSSEGSSREAAEQVTRQKVSLPLAGQAP